MKILVVDDSNQFRSKVCEALKKAGYQDLQDANGESEAVKLLAQDKFNLVITDTQMAASDSGPQLCKFIKKNYSQTKVILMSSSVELLSEAQMNGIPADKFFNKSLGMPSLIKLLKEISAELKK